MVKVEVSGVDISHSRLVDLAKLADQAKPFYDWVESLFRRTLRTQRTLNEILAGASEEQILSAITACYASAGASGVPILTDGVGRTYPHAKACYYFFSWIIRDAPQQRLHPLISRITRRPGQSRAHVEAQVLSRLIYSYRGNVGTFSWNAIREIIIDRLEGSRRSIKGHEKESIARTALVAAFQSYYRAHGNYGHFAKVEIPETQVTVNRETYDVSANLLDESGRRVCRILNANQNARN